MSAPAMLYGVGVGPGDPDLVTVKALKAIAAAEVIAYPRLGEAPSFARSIVADHLAGKREIALTVPLTGGAEAESAYDAAASRIADLLGVGDSVGVLCEGDPLLYGSFIAIWQRLKSRFECEIIPGVSSILAAPARLQVPLVSGRESLAVIPATLENEAIERRIAAADCVVIMKVGRHIERLRALIGRLGLMAGASYIERATMAAERHAPLAEMGDAAAPYFSMIVIRKPVEVVP